MRELKNAVRNMLSRGVIHLVNSAAKCQLVQIEMLGGELKDDVEHLEQYGFTSCPHDGAEAMAVFPDGDKSHGLVLVVGDRRYRLRGLEKGEVALYSDEGDRIVLRRGRRIEIKTLTLEVEAKTKARFDTPLLECTGEISDKTGTMQKMRDQHNDHEHPGGTPTGKPKTRME